MKKKEAVLDEIVLVVQNCAHSMQPGMTNTSPQFRCNIWQVCDTGRYLIYQVECHMMYDWALSAYQISPIRPGMPEISWKWNQGSSGRTPPRCRRNFRLNPRFYPMSVWWSLEWTQKYRTPVGQAVTHDPVCKECESGWYYQKNPNNLFAWRQITITHVVRPVSGSVVHIYAISDQRKTIGYCREYCLENSLRNINTYCNYDRIAEGSCHILDKNNEWFLVSI